MRQRTHVMNRTVSPDSAAWKETRRSADKSQAFKILEEMIVQGDLSQNHSRFQPEEEAQRVGWFAHIEW